MLINYNIDKRLQPKLDDLIKKPVVARINWFREVDCFYLSNQIQAAREAGQTIFPLVIDSFGGECYGLLNMISQIQNCGMDVLTIVEGKAMSAGAILFCMGTYRFMDKNAYIMFHDISTEIGGKVQEIHIDLQHSIKLNSHIFQIASDSIGQDNNFLEDNLKEKGNADWYLNAKQAKKAGVATHIGVPCLNYEAKVEMSISLPKNRK